jgi:hypothetical protein
MNRHYDHPGLNPTKGVSNSPTLGQVTYVYDLDGNHI